MRTSSTTRSEASVLPLREARCASGADLGPRAVRRRVFTEGRLSFPQGLGHRDRRAGPPPLRRREAAPRDRAAPPHGPRARHPGRGDGPPRLRIGARDPGSVSFRTQGPHLARDRASPLHRPECRPGSSCWTRVGSWRRGATTSSSGPGGSTNSFTGPSSRPGPRPDLGYPFGISLSVFTRRTGVLVFTQSSASLKNLPGTFSTASPTVLAG